MSHVSKTHGNKTYGNKQKLITLFVFSFNTGADLHFSYPTPKSLKQSHLDNENTPLRLVSQVLHVTWPCFRELCCDASFLSSPFPSLQPFAGEIQVCAVSEIKGLVMKCLKESRGIYF